MTWWITFRQLGYVEFDTLAEYASISAVIYGVIAVTLDVGGQAMFYTIGAIIKFVDERKADKDDKAVERVSKNPALVEQVMQHARNGRTKERETVGAK